MGAVTRVLPAQPIESLDDYRHAGGGQGMAAARTLGQAAVIDEVEASGLRGRGGSGFPTGVKWRTVAGHASAALPTTVVVNGAEGEPGTFKDRAILQANPYGVLEGALIAAYAVGADQVIIALKETFQAARARIEQAIAELHSTNWADGVEVFVVAGPSSYLYGEETALLEVIAGRPPFPRIAPPYRHGVDEVTVRPGQPGATAMAEPGATVAPPTLANNVETMANVAPLLAEGADWFRSVGTPESPGTIVTTVSGATSRHGVAELAMGTSLAEAIELIGGGPKEGRRLVAALSGVANPPVLADQFHTPLTYEDMAAIGSGLGAAGYIVFDDATDMAAVAAGVSRFLAVESCGQCTPCKQDGRSIAALLERLCAGQGEEHDLAAIADRVGTVSTEARCYLAHQHERVVGGLVQLFPEAMRRHLDPDQPAAAPEAIVPIKDLVGGDATLDLDQLAKQPDWTFDATDSGTAPVDRLGKEPPAA